MNKKDLKKIKGGIGFLIAFVITISYINWLRTRGDILVFFLTLSWIALMYFIYKKFEVNKK